jgi:hypothetical protein
LSIGNVYDGEWNDDLMDGFGTFVFTNGDIYEGINVNFISLISYTNVTYFNKAIGKMIK